MSTYSFANSWENARQRLASIEAQYDPATIRQLERCGIADGWHCLEVGGGGGSIAAWLCERVGPRGSVLATDIEPHFLAALDYPNLTAQRHNIVTDELPERAFDLVHARMLLEHLPERDRVLRRLVAALRPGGWLLCEDLDEGSIGLIAPADAASQAVFTLVQQARKAVMQSRGHVPAYGRQLAALFRDAGLVDVRAEGQVPVFQAGPEAEFARLTIAQLRGAIVEAGAATAADIDAYTALLASPSFTMVGPTLFAARGRRPAG